MNDADRVNAADAALLRRAHAAAKEAETLAMNARVNAEDAALREAYSTGNAVEWQRLIDAQHAGRVDARDHRTMYDR
jgi:hypothetical protein